MSEDKRFFSRLFKTSVSCQNCKQVSHKSSWWKSSCICRPRRFSEQFFIENVYEQLSNGEWNGINKTQYSGSTSQKTEQIMVMETQTLSSIPECFPSGSDVETSFINKRRSILNFKTRGNNEVITRKWSPIETWNFGYKTDWNSKNETISKTRKDEQPIRTKEVFRDKNPLKKRIYSKKKDYNTLGNKSEIEHFYSCTENKSQSKIKVETKVSTNTKRHKTKLTSKVQGHFHSTGKIETSFSFASYIKRGNPQFQSRCTRKLTTFENEVNVQQPLKHNVTFNPIFQEDVSRTIDPRNYRLYTILEEPEEEF